MKYGMPSVQKRKRARNNNNNNNQQVVRRSKRNQFNALYPVTPMNINSPIRRNIFTTKI